MENALLVTSKDFESFNWAWYIIYWSELGKGHILLDKQTYDNFYSLRGRPRVAVWRKNCLRLRLKSRALHQHASSSKSHFIILDFCSTLILCGIYWTAVLWSLFVLALSTFCQKVCTIKPGRSGICFSRAYWNRSYEILSNTCYLNIFTNLFRQRYVKKKTISKILSHNPNKTIFLTFENPKQVKTLVYIENSDCMLKVSKSRKQILKFSFEPKKRTKYFCISALA